MSVQDKSLSGAPGAKYWSVLSMFDCRSLDPSQAVAVSTEPSTNAANHAPPASIAACATSSVPAKPPRGGSPNSDAMPTVCPVFVPFVASNGTVTARFAASSAAPSAPARDADSTPNSAQAVCKVTPARSAEC